MTRDEYDRRWMVITLIVIATAVSVCGVFIVEQLDRIAIALEAAAK